MAARGRRTARDTRRLRVGWAAQPTLQMPRRCRPPALRKSLHAQHWRPIDPVVPLGARCSSGAACQRPRGVRGPNTLSLRHTPPSVAVIWQRAQLSLPLSPATSAGTTQPAPTHPPRSAATRTHSHLLILQPGWTASSC
jgi:hypothetical protein